MYSLILDELFMSLNWFIVFILTVQFSSPLEKQGKYLMW